MTDPDGGTGSAPLVCPGCGVALQSQFDDRPGFVPPARLTDLAAQPAPLPLCRRCYRLRHYGELDARGVPSPEEAGSLARDAIGRADLVWLIVDLMDVGVSLAPEVMKALSGQIKPVIVIGTKYDLLPEVAVAAEVRVWLSAEVRAAGVEPAEVLVAGKGGRRRHQGINPPEAVWEASAAAASRTARAFLGGLTIAVLGATNTGKSTYIGRMAGADARRKPRTPGPLVSRLAGTTRGLMELEVVTHGATLIDTPGIPALRARAQDGLGERCASSLVPAKALQSRLERLRPGQALLLGGMGMVALEATGDDEVTLLAYAPDALRLHKTQVSRWSELWDAHAGEWLTPPGPGCRSILQRRGFEDVRIRVQPREDIELGGLGWVSIRGVQAGPTEYAFSVLVPTGTLVRTRPALLQPRRRIGDLRGRRKEWHGRGREWQP